MPVELLAAAAKDAAASWLESGLGVAKPADMRLGSLRVLEVRLGRGAHRVLD